MHASHLSPLHKDWTLQLHPIQDELSGPVSLNSLFGVENANGMNILEWPFPGQQLYIPDHFESQYAYPLIVWLMDENAADDELETYFPEISERNYVGLSIRVKGVKEAKSSSQNSANDLSNADLDGLSTFQEELLLALDTLPKMLKINTRRIYLAGRGQAATVALKLGLSLPYHFAGVLSLSPARPQLNRLLGQYRELRHLRVFLGTTEDQTSPEAREIREFAELLQLAGLDSVLMNQYKKETFRFPHVLRDFNRFVMEGISTSVK
jgi:predicted peptidase